MKRALCFVVLINKEAKTVLDWLLSDKFIRGFHMYDLRSVGYLQRVTGRNKHLNICKYQMYFSRVKSRLYYGYERAQPSEITRRDYATDG